MSDDTIYSMTLDESIIILDVSFTLIYDVYRTGITYDDCYMLIVQATDYETSYIMLFIKVIET